MSRKGYATISIWSATAKALDQYRAELAKRRGLPKGKLVSRTEAVEMAVQFCLQDLKENPQ